MGESKITLHVVDLGGAGEPLIFLHGWAQSLTALKPLAELLMPEVRPILIDLPGHGDSPKPPAPWGSAEFAEAVFAELSRRGISRFAVLGHSLGGRVALRLAYAHPEQVSRIILVGAAGLPRTLTGWKLHRAKLVKKLGRFCRTIDNTLRTALFERFFVPRFGSRDYRAAGELRPTLVKLVNEDLSSVAGALSQPTLLLWGGKDTEAPPEIGERYHQLLRHSQLVIFPEHGHEPFGDVGAHLCASYIERFLQEKLPRDAMRAHG